MRPLPEYERLHRQLEKHLPYKHGKEQLDQPQPPDPSATTQNDSEIDALVALACHVQQTYAGFAQRLEVRILSHHLALRQQEAAKKRGSRFFSPSFRMAIVGAVALVCFLLGTSLLALAAPITNPNNPLYAIKNWEQHVQLSLAHPPSNQTEASQPIAHHPLSTPTSIARNHISDTPHGLKPRRLLTPQRSRASERL